MADNSRQAPFLKNQGPEMPFIKPPSGPSLSEQLAADARARLAATAAQGKAMMGDDKPMQHPGISNDHKSPF